MSLDSSLVCTDKRHAVVCEGNIIPGKSALDRRHCVGLFYLRPDAVEELIVPRCSWLQLNQQPSPGFARANLRTMNASADFRYYRSPNRLKSYHYTAVNRGMRADECFHDKRRDLVPIGQDNNIIASSLESPKVWVFGVLDIEILQIDRVFLGKCLKNTLEQFPVLVAMNPVLKHPRFDFFELKARVWMEGKTVPVLPVDYQIADEESFSRTSKVQYTNHFVHF